MKNALFSRNHFLFSISLVALVACKKDNKPAPPAEQMIVFSANGDIAPKMNEFRQRLGAQLNTTPGATGGRREVNWDGVPDALEGQRLPENFFNPTEPGANPVNQRGLVYTAPGDFQASKTGFAQTNAKAAGEFQSFSGAKTFTNTGNKLWDVEFQVAGQSVAAKVQGFGAVFSDVDVEGKTTLEFFNEDKSLGKFSVPVHTATNSFSFLGVYFTNESITRVRVTHDGVLTDAQDDISNGGPADLVVMDDFLYSEPVKIQ